MDKLNVNRFTPQNEMFCQQYAINGNATRAYLSAYSGVTYESANADGSRLIVIDSIKTRIAEIQEGFLSKIDESKRSHIKELMRVSELVLEKERYSDYTRLRDLINKMAGFYLPEITQEQTIKIINYIRPDDKSIEPIIEIIESKDDETTSPPDERPTQD